MPCEPLLRAVRNPSGTSPSGLGEYELHLGRINLTPASPCARYNLLTSLERLHHDHQSRRRGPGRVALRSMEGPLGGVLAKQSERHHPDKSIAYSGELVNKKSALPFSTVYAVCVS